MELSQGDRRAIVLVPNPFPQNDSSLMGCAKMDRHWFLSQILEAQRALKILDSGSQLMLVQLIWSGSCHVQMGVLSWVGHLQ